MESIIEALTCNLVGRNNKQDRHFLTNPKYLPCCRRSACNKCIIRYVVDSARSSSSSRTNNADYDKKGSRNIYSFDCPFCKEISKIELNQANDQCNLESDLIADREFERYSNDINHHLIGKLENSLKNIEERFDSKEVYLKKRKSYIQKEIHVQVETLKNHLDELESQMIESLDESCRNADLNMKKFQESSQIDLNDMKIAVGNLKSNAYNYAYEPKVKSNPTLALTMQQQSIDKTLSLYDELNKMNRTMSEMMGELRFDPNIELPGPSIIGYLKSIREINHIDQFKRIKSQSQIVKIKSIAGTSQKMPISPRYLCILDSQTLLFTDSQTKQIVQLMLDSGDFVRSTNLNGMLKSPDGICVNPKMGHIYVSDSELNLIFKLDYQFNLIKKFGLKDLKWPRGLAYDFESNFQLDGKENPNRLYVCDHSNQRVAIYNDHDQLRDCLTISISDEPLPNYKQSKNSYSMSSDKKTNNIEDEIKFCPLNVVVTRANVYVTDDWIGGNCIRVFDKLTHTLLRNVGDLNAWNPLGLIVDDIGNIFTAARLYYETGSTHLYCFNKNGNLLYKTNLNVSSECIADLVVDKHSDKTNHRIICCGDKKLNYFQF